MSLLVFFYLLRMRLLLFRSDEVNRTSSSTAFNNIIFEYRLCTPKHLKDHYVYWCEGQQKTIWKMKTEVDFGCLEPKLVSLAWYVHMTVLLIWLQCWSSAMIYFYFADIPFFKNLVNHSLSAPWIRKNRLDVFFPAYWSAGLYCKLHSKLACVWLFLPLGHILIYLWSIEGPLPAGHGPRCSVTAWERSANLIQ